MSVLGGFFNVFCTLVRFLEARAKNQDNAPYILVRVGIQLERIADWGEFVVGGDANHVESGLDNEKVPNSQLTPTTLGW